MMKTVRTLALALVLAVTPLLASVLAPFHAQAAQSTVVMPTTGPLTMGNFVGTYLNPALQSLTTCWSGASAPATPAPVAGQCWWDTTANPYSLKYYDGASWTSIGTLNTSTHVWTGAGVGLTVGSTAITSGTTTRILYDNAGALGEYTISGTGTVVAMQTSPALVTPAIGVATGTSLALNGCTLSTNAFCATGTANISGATTLGGALTYGGVTLSNAVTGTGNMVLSAGPTLTGTLTASVGSFSSTLASTAHTITSASATALTVGLNGAINPAFTIDASTGSQAAGFKITGAATGGTVALVATDSGSNTNVTINAKGSGTIGIGSVSTGAVTITPALTLSAALTYGGVTLSNSVTGTGSMVLSAAPTLTGHPTIEGITSTGATGTGAFVFSAAPTITGAMAASGTLSIASAAIGSNALAATGRIANTSDYGFAGSFEGFATTAGALARTLSTRNFRLDNSGNFVTNSNSTMGWTSVAPGGGSDAANVADLILGRAAAASLRLGDVTGSGAAVAQTLTVQGSSGNSAAAALFTIAGSDQAGTTTTGGGVKIRGGNGTSAGGTVEIWTSATTTPAVAATFGADKSAVFAGVVTIGNTLNVVSPTAPNRTVTMVVNGTTVYIAAKTTND